MDHVKMIAKEQIEKILDMKRTIDMVEKVYELHGKDQVLMPAKITLDTGESNDWPPYGGSYNAMPAYIGGDIDISGIKWVWGFNDNRAKGIPYIGGVIILNEARTGEVLSIMDGSYITDIRTGASAGVAARYLANQDSTVLAIIGAGVQGRMNARAILEELDIEELRITDIRPGAAEEYAREMSEELGIRVVPCTTNEEACRGADVIITVTIADGKVTDIKGYSCDKGKNYAAQETIRPMRVLTSTVRIEHGTLRVLPVITNREIPLDLCEKAMEEIRKITIEAPVQMDQVIVKDFLGTGADLIAS